MAPKHLDIGKYGENEAIIYLKQNNYIIIDRNWRCKTNKSEIDIIATKKNFLIFIEVKTRSKNFIIQPEEAVNKKKINLLIQLANSYSEEKNNQKEIRFDIIAITINSQKKEINHIKNAFESNF